MISTFIYNVCRKRHGCYSKVTQAQWHTILSNFAHQSGDDDALILLSHTYHTPPKMFIVFSTLRRLHNARLQAIEVRRCGTAV